MLFTDLLFSFKDLLGHLVESYANELSWRGLQSSEEKKS